MSILCEIEPICVQGMVNWSVIVVAIPLILLTILFAGFCGIILMSALKPWLGKIVAVFKNSRDAQEQE